MCHPDASAGRLTHPMNKRSKNHVSVLVAGALLTTVASASSHREAPLITKQPKLDAADFYMFGSYEPGRADYVTFVADYLPLQDLL